MSNKKDNIEKIIERVFINRYLISFIVFLLILGLGLYLYLCRPGHSFKDVSQICTGLLIVLTLFFTALNYEFNNSKTKSDKQASKDMLAYQISSEWHKPPISDFQKISIKWEEKFKALEGKKDIVQFNAFINELDHIEFKESLKGIINHFECVSTATHNNLVNSTYVKDYYGGIFSEYYQDYLQYIDFERNRLNNPRIWVSFTTLVEEWYPEIKEQRLNKEIISQIIK